MLERFIERKLVNLVKREGGLCPKFTSPGSAGWPDRLILLPGGRIAFAELKAPEGRLSPLQIQRHIQLRDLGFTVFVINDPAQIPAVLAILCKPNTRKKARTFKDLAKEAAKEYELQSTSVPELRD